MGRKGFLQPADAGVDQSFGAEPLAVTFDGTNSFDPDGQPVTYRWDFTDRTPPSVQGLVSHTFPLQDITPSATTIAKAFNLVLMDEKVEAVLVNIFAGINRCDWVAQGLVQALEALDLTIPVVVRLAGTNVEEGRRIFEQSGLPVITADSLADAAEKVVAAWKAASGEEGERS